MDPSSKAPAETQTRRPHLSSSARSRSVRVLLNAQRKLVGTLFAAPSSAFGPHFQQVVRAQQCSRELAGAKKRGGRQPSPLDLVDSRWQSRRLARVSRDARFPRVRWVLHSHLFARLRLLALLGNSDPHAEERPVDEEERNEEEHAGQDVRQRRVLRCQLYR